MASLYRAGGLGYGEAKHLCFEALNSELGEPREKYKKIRKDIPQLEGILESGRDKARSIATKVTERVRAKVGL